MSASKITQSVVAAKDNTTEYLMKISEMQAKYDELLKNLEKVSEEKMKQSELNMKSKLEINQLK